MSRVKCVEAVYGVLVGAGLRTDNQCFDDAVFGCVEVSLPGSAYQEPTTWVADMDDTRTEVEVILDFIEWAAASGCQEPISNVLARAVAAGRKGWYHEDGVSPAA